MSRKIQTQLLLLFLFIVLIACWSLVRPPVREMLMGGG